MALDLGGVFVGVQTAAQDPLRALRGSIADALDSRACQDLEPTPTPSEWFWSHRAALNFAGER